jgi:hypothetical protein
MQEQKARHTILAAFSTSFAASEKANDLEATSAKLPKLFSK